MRRRTRAIGITLAAVALVRLPAVAQQPTFKAAVDLVRVDVAVTRGGKPVRGLTAADFSISDDGVPQRVNSVTLLDDLALSVLVVLDTSSSVEGERLQHLVEAGRGLMAALRPDDRAGLITFNDRVRLDVPLGKDRDAIAATLGRLTGTGSTALHDAVWTALELCPVDDTRPLVLVFTDGLDNASWLSQTQFVAAARRKGVVIQAVELTNGVPASARGRTGPLPALDFAADASGGRVWSATSSRDLRELFTKAIEEMRGRYLVTFYPEGPRKPGWHALKIGARGRGDITARPGYYLTPR